jgi:hypothetical protein
MIKLPNNLEQLESLIKQTTDGMDGLKTHIKGLEENLAIHKGFEKQLRQNLSVLKDVNIISIASEFKKIKQELAIASSRITEASIDLKNSFVYLERSEKLLMELKSRCDIIKESQKGKVLNFTKR